MIIELERAHTPEDYHRDDECGICMETFPVEAVRASVLTEDRHDLGLACPGCVRALGRHRPGRFPTIEEYEEAVRRFDAAGSIWASAEEADRALEEGKPHRDALEASRIRRALPGGGAAARRAAMVALGRNDAFTIAGRILDRVPDDRFGNFDREHIARVLADAADETGEELSRYRRAFGIPPATRTICRVGSKTDTPCRRVATEFVNEEDSPDMCWPHAFAMRLREAGEDIGHELKERLAEFEAQVLSLPED